MDLALWGKAYAITNSNTGSLKLMANGLLGSQNYLCHVGFLAGGGVGIRTVKHLSTMVFDFCGLLFQTGYLF